MARHAQILWYQNDLWVSCKYHLRPFTLSFLLGIIPIALEDRINFGLCESTIGESITANLDHVCLDNQSCKVLTSLNFCQRCATVTHCWWRSQKWIKMLWTFRCKNKCSVENMLKILWKSMAAVNCLIADIQSIFFCVQRKKVTHTGLEQHEGE